MAEDDIYDSKRKYEDFKLRVDRLADGPSHKRAKYYCKNPSNIQYFHRLFRHFESRDLSYIRRNRLLQSMRLISHIVLKDLSECSRDDVDGIVAAMHQVYSAPRSKQTFIADVKYFWKLLFPETDNQGRPDDTAIPYVVRHLSRRLDKSRQQLRQDKLSWDEFESIINYFASEPRMQCYLAVAFESLARPQELLYRRIGNVEHHDCYARIYLTDHGKEGPGLLQCIDSYPYLLKWLEVHPFPKDKNAFLFVNVGGTKHGKQMKPPNVNRMLRTACKALGISKPVTCYSLKRNGVTMRRLRGESDMEIQHAARWTSTKQLKTYDMSNQEEAFRRELEKRGLVPAADSAQAQAKRCDFCGHDAGFGEALCQQCKRPLDKNVIRQDIKEKDQRIEELTRSVSLLAAQLAQVKETVLHDLAADILARKARRRGAGSGPMPSSIETAPVYALEAPADWRR
jgi:hypothetical protein